MMMMITIINDDTVNINKTHQSDSIVLQNTTHYLRGAITVTGPDNMAFNSTVIEKVPQKNYK